MIDNCSNIFYIKTHFLLLQKTQTNKTEIFFFKKFKKITKFSFKRDNIVSKNSKSDHFT